MDCGDLQVRPARDDGRGFLEPRVAELWGLPVIGRRRGARLVGDGGAGLRRRRRPARLRDIRPGRGAACELVVILALRDLIELELDLTR